MAQTREEFVASMPIGWHTIGDKTRYYSREEWEDFWAWCIQGRDDDPNVKEVREILEDEIPKDVLG